ncbi:hypothetical protein QM306_41355, partial [Burkholderia cenocepacia]|nr:hypothetical protein [Burkholderia cenocepacia]
RELLYVRNFGQGLDLPWQQSFGTDEPAEVERMCATRGSECAWRTDDDGELLLRTRERCQAVARHPRTGDRVWFNQANLFHLSAAGCRVHLIGGAYEAAELDAKRA